MHVFEKVPSYTYATIKYHLQKLSLLKTQINLLATISLLLSVITVPIISLLFGIILLYRKTIDLILRYKLKHLYRGLLPPVDTTCCDQEVCTPSFFLLVDYAKSHEELRQDFINILQQCRYARHEKLFYSWTTFCGYHYYYKNALKVEDYVTVAERNEDIDVIRDKKDFADVILQYDTAKMPDDGRALIQVIVYTQKVDLPNVEGCKLVCFKMHHALADGKAMIGWLMSDLADKIKDETLKNGCSKNGVGAKQNGVADMGSKSLGKCAMDDFLKSCKKTLFDDKIKMLASDCDDDNILLGRNLLEEKFICWFSDFSSEYIDKIKAIRKSRDGVSFLDVINTCISTSLHAYFENHSENVPDVISGGVVLSPEKYTFKYGNPSDFTFSNEFSVGGFKFPIGIHRNALDKRETILANLNFCRKEYQAVKESIDVKYYYWLNHVISILPCQIPMYLSKFLRISIGVSSLPGTNTTMSIFGGNLVKDVIMMPPNSPGTALHFVNCTYGNNFRLCLTIDKSVVGNFDDAQEIVDGVVKNIDLLYEIVSYHG